MSIFPWILDYIKQKKWLEASTHHSLPPHCGCPMASCLKLLMRWLPPWDRHSPRTLNPLSFSFITRLVQETHSLNRLSGPTAFVGIFFITARSQETNIATTPGHYTFKFYWNLFYVMLFYVNKKPRVSFIMIDLLGWDGSWSLAHASQYSVTEHHDQPCFAFHTVGFKF